MNKIEPQVVTGGASLAVPQVVTGGASLAVQPIEESFDKNVEYKPVTERYYKKYYFLDVGKKCEDYCVMVHSNRICVVTLAPSHPLLAENKTISSIDFRVSKNVDRSNNKVSGKRKHGAQNLLPASPIFFALCTDGNKFSICSPVTGKLVEINESIKLCPNRLVEDPNETGFIAIIQPPIADYDRYTSEFLSFQEYTEALNKRAENNLMIT